jgi:hypothetical protein
MNYQNINHTMNNPTKHICLPLPLLSIGLREIDTVAEICFEEDDDKTFSKFGIVREKSKVSEYLQELLHIKKEHADYLIVVHNEIGMTKLN